MSYLRGILILGAFLGLFPCCAEEPTVHALKQTVSRVAPSILGWCSQEKAESFIDLVLEVKPQVCVEIGVFGGASAFPVASALNYLGAGVLYAIDPWDKLECIRDLDPDKDAAHIEWWGRVNLHQIYLQYIYLMKEHQLEPCCHTLKMTSEKASQYIDQIDILYIDGHHAERPLVQDVKLYLPKVKSGGYIWFNDAGWDQAHQAMLLLTQACDLVKFIDRGNCVLFKKR